MISSKTKEKELQLDEIKTIEELNSIPKFKPWVIDNLTKKRLFLMILSFILTLGPIRFIIVILLHLICLIFMQIMVIGTKPQKPYSNFRKRLIEIVTQFLCRLACFFYGYVHIKFVGEKNYKNWKKNRNERIIISNHSSLLDMEVILSFITGGFVAKESVRHMPFIGNINKCLQGLFIDRTKKNSWVFEEIKKRGEIPGLFPLVIFPEGTTSNNKCLLSFKVGAFSAGMPVQPIIIKYKACFPLSFLDLTDTYYHPLVVCMSQFCNLYNSIEMTFMDPIVPNSEEKKNPKLYSQSVQKKMNEVSQLPIINSRFRDSLEYREIIKKIQKQKNCKKNK
ncbi:lysophosphatidylcholine acyltransferase [Anaeramoeba flamelloides]|uniref:Lysophosphatidylcholine acyltransferase n=1 Tax=Anaeramoeba flamelloides TaxID=1746091 RepID=A0AAV7ZFF7_9EUKA|nr:lysophosphatidylcholine acyltransferase [Anaeramoeba flamelloides]